MVYYLHGLHKQVTKTITSSNAKYKAPADTYHKRVVAKFGDLVWVIFTHEKFQQATTTRKLLDEGSEHLCEDLTLLDEDLIYVNYMNDLTVAFMNQQNMFRFKKIYSCARPG